MSPPEKTIKRRAATDGETALPCRTAQLKINILVYYTKIKEKTQKETVAKFHFLQRPSFTQLPYSCYIEFSKWLCIFPSVNLENSHKCFLRHFHP
ncbi:hypothetical protein, partial [Anaerovibrio slackiae]|uniref:hypothetical protein n=1 Tax=Anaerovibrio slackiae TaxID=2652309 RepID=UPI00386991B9